MNIEPTAPPSPALWRTQLDRWLGAPYADPTRQEAQGFADPVPAAAAMTPADWPRVLPGL